MKRRKKENPTLKKLDISFGALVRSGYERVDFDPKRFPWPLKDASCEELFCAYQLCRTPGRERGRFMDEAHRVLTVGGKLTVVEVYWSSPRSIQDFTHEWPPIVEQSFLYFNKQWRAQNGVDGNLSCDFDFIYGYNYEQETMNRADDAKSFWVKRYLNSVNDLQVTLTKRGQNAVQQAK